jgi:GNAT superfamily N-acetyltransferase
MRLRGVQPGSITVTDAPAAADFAVIFRGLDDCTAAVVGPAALYPLAVLLRDDAGAVVGGLWGRTGYSWLTIEMLFVPEPLRRRGFGTRLVEMAEDAARARGCIGAQVSSFDFQAPAFYRRLGFEVFGVQQDLPPGHCTYYLSKRFRGRAAN